FGNVRRSFRIAGELHRIRRPTLCCRTQVGGVTEHLRQRNFSTDDLARRALIHTLHKAATTVQVANNVTHVVFRGNNLNLHDRLKKGRIRFEGAFLHRHGTSDFERHLVGVNVVIGTIVQRRFDTQQRIAGQTAVLHLLFDTLLNSRDVFLGNHTTNDLVHKDEVLAIFNIQRQRLKLHFYVTVLTTTTGLTNKLAFNVNRLADTLTVRNLRLPDVGLYLELATHTVNNDVQVKLTHTGDDGLAGLFVGANTERRILLGQLAQRNTHLFLVGF